MAETEVVAYSNWLCEEIDSAIILEKLSCIRDSLIVRGITDIDAALEGIINDVKENMYAAKELEMKEEVKDFELVLSTYKQFINDMASTELDGELIMSDLPPKKLTFAKTETGNYYIDVDLKDIKFSDDVYIRLKNILNFIESGQRINNQTIARKLSNNKNYKDIIEYKNYQVRVYVKTLSDNVVCIIGARIKKGDNPKSIVSYLSARNKAISKSLEIEKLSTMLFGDKRQFILEENQAKRNEIMAFLANKGQEVKTPCKPKKVIQEKQKKAPKEKVNDTEDYPQLDPEWARVYGIACYISNERNKLGQDGINVKSHYVFNGYPFGKWVKRQKDNKSKGLLSELQINLLEDLGIKWHITEQELNKLKVTRTPKEKIEILTLEPENENIETLDVTSLKKAKDVIKRLEENDLEKSIGSIYQGLLTMNDAELNEFILRIENDDLVQKNINRDSLSK